MNIGIIGAGNVGSALAKAAVGAGHSVTITSTDRAEAQATGRVAAPHRRAREHEPVLRPRHPYI